MLLLDKTYMPENCKLRAEFNTLKFDHGVIQNDHWKCESISKERNDQLIQLPSKLSASEKKYNILL
jgi:hypothetical protein